MPMWLTGRVRWALWPGSLVSLTPMVPSQSSSKRAKKRPRPSGRVPAMQPSSRSQRHSRVPAGCTSSSATMRPIIARNTGMRPTALGGLALDGG